MEIKTKVRIYFMDGFEHDYERPEFKAWVDDKVRWLSEYTDFASVESEDYCCKVESVGLGAFLVRMVRAEVRLMIEADLKMEDAPKVELTL